MDNVMENEDVKKFEAEDPFLFEAIHRGDLDSINHLLSIGCKNFREPETLSIAIQLAVDSKNLEVLEKLITVGAHKYSIRNLKLTALNDLCWIEDVKILRGLVPLIKDVNQQDGVQKTMLYYAVMANNAALVKALLEHNANVSIVLNQFQNTVLHYACAAPDIDIEIIKAFVASGADFDIQCADGRTAFFKALAVAKHDVVWYILTHAKPSITAQFEYGPTALHYAAKNVHVDMIEALVDFGLDVNGKACRHKRYVNPEYADFVPLNMAILYSRSQVYEYLIYRGAEYNVDQICMSENKLANVMEIDKQVLKPTALRKRIKNDLFMRSLLQRMTWHFNYMVFNHFCHVEIKMMAHELIRPGLSILRLVSSTPKKFLKYYDEHPCDLIEIMDCYEERYPIYIPYFRNTVLRDVQKEFRKRRAVKIITHFLETALNYASHYIAQKIVQYMTPFDLMHFNDVSCMDIINKESSEQ